MRLVLESNGNLDCNMYDLEKEVLGRDILLDMDALVYET